MAEPDDEVSGRYRPGRREFFAAAGIAAAGGVGGWLLGSSTTHSEPAAAPTDSATPLDAAHQVRGVTWPAVPPRHSLTSVLRIPGADAATVLAAARAVRGIRPSTDEDGGEPTVVVGVAAAHAASLWPDRAAAAVALPAFRYDAPDLRADGDLVLQVAAETAFAAQEATRQLRDAVPDAEVVWQARGSRDAPTPAGTTRTSTGFIDGIVNPRTPAELDAGVWAAPPRRDTYLVVRRMTVASGFFARGVPDQERAIGRHRDTGAPLSGGGPLDQVDLFAKTPEGELLTPRTSHAGRAHPAHTGRPLMLRRSYSLDGVEGVGIVFTAFMSDPQTFVLTQRRLDEADDLIAQTTTDASGCFFVPDDLGG